MTSGAIHDASRQHDKEEVGFVLRGLVVAAVLLFAIGSANAQTSPPTERGPAAPKNVEGEPTEAPANGQTPQKTDVKVDPASEGFKVGLFTFKPGGRIKLDIIKDYDAITSEDSFDPRTIVVPAADGGNSRLHARETRLFLDIRGLIGTEAEGKELRMYVEGDFYGSGSVFRLRHAYGSYGGLLAGQTWTNFLDPDNFPNTIDFESPMAFPSFRQAQVRFTAKLNDKSSWAVSVEDNNSSDREPRGARQGRVPESRSDHQHPLRGVARTRLCLALSRQGALSPDRGRSGQCDAVGVPSLGEAEDLRQ